MPYNHLLEDWFMLNPVKIADGDPQAGGVLMARPGAGPRSGGDAAVLDAVEGRLQTILDPYRERLEPATVYGMPVLRRPGAKAHEFFAAVRPARAYVTLHLMPVYHHPELLDAISPALRARLTGKSTLGFAALDDPLLAELAGLVARAFAAYEADGADGAT